MAYYVFVLQKEVTGSFNQDPKIIQVVYRPGHDLVQQMAEGRNRNGLRYHSKVILIFLRMSWPENISGMAEGTSTHLLNGDPDLRCGQSRDQSDELPGIA